jgi:preprotein translocase subunit Sec63
MESPESPLPPLTTKYSPQLQNTLLRMDFVDYYKILQLPHTANQDEIKTAYRQLAKTMHPDKNPEDNQATLNFQNVSNYQLTQRVY